MRAGGGSHGGSQPPRPATLAREPAAAGAGAGAPGRRGAGREQLSAPTLLTLQRLPTSEVSLTLNGCEVYDPYGVVSDAQCQTTTLTR